MIGNIKLSFRIEINHFRNHQKLAAVKPNEMDTMSKQLDRTIKELLIK